MYLPELEDLGKLIEEENEAFNNMSKAEKRVQIARDCLVRIDLDQFAITCGWTIKLTQNNKNLLETDSIKDTINNFSLPECHVCAKGGLFMSYIGRVNNFKFSEVRNDNNPKTSPEMKKLMEIFTKRQLNGIECAFEGKTYTFHHDQYYDFYLLCSQYTLEMEKEHGFLTPKEYLKSICKNIIKNKGTFNPKDIVSPFTNNY